MYCSKCGKEMPDDAVVCTGCGCLLKKTAEKVTPVQQAETNSETYYVEDMWKKRKKYMDDRYKKITKILFFASLSVFCFALFLFGNTFLHLSVYSAFTKYYDVVNVIQVDQTGCTLSWVFSILGLGCSVAGLVTATKQESEALKMSSVVMFAMAFTMFVIFLNACIVFVF